jgi:hypothetical protein
MRSDDGVFTGGPLGLDLVRRCVADWRGLYVLLSLRGLATQAADAKPFVIATGALQPLDLSSETPANEVSFLVGPTATFTVTGEVAAVGYAQFDSPAGDLIGLVVRQEGMEATLHPVRPADLYA